MLIYSILYVTFIGWCSPLCFASSPFSIQNAYHIPCCILYSSIILWNVSTFTSYALRDFFSYILACIFPLLFLISEVAWSDFAGSDLILLITLWMALSPVRHPYSVFLEPQISISPLISKLRFTFYYNSHLPPLLTLFTSKKLSHLL